MMQTAPKASILSDIQSAQAFSLAYDLFGRIYLKGASPDMLDSIAAVPELDQALGKTSHEPGIVDFEGAASEHFNLFHFNVFPYQSMFLDTGGSLGGEQSEQVLAYYHKAGFDLSSDPLGSGESPDHIGLELAFLSFLSDMEAQALPEGEDFVPSIRSLQRGFFDLHLLPWLPVLVQAIDQQESPFYSALAKLTLELAFAHYTALSERTLGRQAAFALPPPPAVLENEKSGLKDIADFLLTPAYSGLYLSREDIARLGRGRRLPRGFGDRRQMLANLLRSAVEYDQLPELMADMKALVRNWQAAYRAHLEEETPWSYFAGAWQERLRTTSAILNRLSTEAGKGEECSVRHESFISNI